MSYLKIYTKSIVIHRECYKDFVGELMLDYDFYGVAILNKKIQIEISRACEAEKKWILKPSDNNNPQIKDSFWMVFNCYLFDILKFDPESQWMKTESGMYLQHFNNIYFDVGAELSVAGNL